MDAEARRGALDAYFRFFDTFNSRDAEAWAAALQFPHVRVSHRGPVDIVPSAAAYAAATSWERIEDSGWDHTEPLEPEMVHEGADRFHIAGGWTRYTKGGEPILSSLVTYVVTRVGTSWGIQARFGVDPAGAARTAGDALQAEAAVRGYLEHWNEKRFEQAASALNYPYVRVNPGEVIAWQSADEHFSWLTAQPWRPIAATEVRILQEGPSAANVAVRLADGRLSRECLLLVTLRGGHWGVQAESTY